MSKALETAEIAFNTVYCNQPDDERNVGPAIEAAISAYLAHLAEDEAVVVAVGRAANQAWHVWLAESRITSSQADVAQKTPAHAAGIAALRTLAGKG